MKDNASNQMEKLARIEERRKKIMQGGGQAAVEKLLRSRAKLTPLERMEMLFDPGTFHEMGLWAKPLKTGFDIDKAEIPRDAMVAGYGELDGRPYISKVF